MSISLRSSVFTLISLLTAQASFALLSTPELAVLGSAKARCEPKVLKLRALNKQIRSSLAAQLEDAEKRVGEALSAPIKSTVDLVSLAKKHHVIDAGRTTAKEAREDVLDATKISTIAALCSGVEEGMVLDALASKFAKRQLPMRFEPLFRQYLKNRLESPLIGSLVFSMSYAVWKDLYSPKAVPPKMAEAFALVKKQRPTLPTPDTKNAEDLKWLEVRKIDFEERNEMDNHEALFREALNEMLN